MIKPFTPDKFSNSIPEWHQASDAINYIIEELCISLRNFVGPLQGEIYQSGALEINSNNFRLKTSHRFLLLKCWPSQKPTVDIEKSLSLMAWINQHNQLSPAPIELKNNSYTCEYKGNLYSFFKFVEANYFSGKSLELENTATDALKLHTLLKESPPDLISYNAPQYFTHTDNNTLERMIAERKDWQKIFGEEYTALLEESWGNIIQYWNKLEESPPYAGAPQMSHFDLHPHNILMKGDNVAAFIDFDSCAFMPCGYAISFNALKQCKQAVIAHGANTAKEMGALYKQKIEKYYPDIHGIKELAISEVLRRLSLIFRLNLNDNNTRWNNVIPLQLAHLYEAEILFD